MIERLYVDRRGALVSCADGRREREVELGDVVRWGDTDLEVERVDRVFSNRFRHVEFTLFVRRGTQGTAKASRPPALPVSAEFAAKKFQRVASPAAGPATFTRA